ncbi:MAG: glycosyltransferase family 2 protein [Methanobacterium sp.]
MNFKITIIVLNWNGWEDTIECMKSLEQINYSNYDLIIVDNGSHDNSVEKIRHYCDKESKSLNYFEYKENEVIDDNYNPSKNVMFIRNHENYGFAEGNNIGIRFALKYLNPNYILLLNNDTAVDKYFLDKLVLSCGNDKKIALSQAKLLKYEDHSILDSTGGILDKYGFGISRGSDEEDTGKYDENLKEGFFYVLGTCMFISVEFINKTDPDEFLDSLIFAVHDDVDVSWYARLLGYEVAYCPDSICYHKQHKSFKKKPSDLVSFLLFKNSIRILIKYYSTKNLIFYLPLKLAIEFILSFSGIFVNRDSSNFKNFIKAVIWNIKHLSDTTNKRKEIQSKRKVKDGEILKFMEKGSLKIRNLQKN